MGRFRNHHFIITEEIPRQNGPIHGPCLTRKDMVCICMASFCKVTLLFVKAFWERQGYHHHGHHELSSRQASYGGNGRSPPSEKGKIRSGTFSLLYSFFFFVCGEKRHPSFLT